MAGITGQAFTILRTLFVAARVGTSPTLDALLVALVIPLIASGLLVSSLRTAVVPAYFEIARDRDDLHARRFVGMVITWIALLGTLATVLLTLVPWPAIAVSGPGLDGTSREASTRFLPMVAPILVMSAVSTMLGALCQITARFKPIAIGLALAPLTSFGVTVALWSRLGLDALAFGLVLGELTTLVVTLAYMAWVGFLPPLAFRSERADLTRFFRHALPLTIGSGVLQLNLLADRAVASLLAPGAVSALTYGQQVVLSPLNSVSYAWTMVAYPWLVRAAQDGTARSLGAGAARATRASLAIFMPLVVGAAALAPLVVDVVYRRGAFDARAAELTVGVVVAFAPMLLLTMVQPILTGAHNARRHGTLLALVAVGNALINLLLNIVFGLTIGVAGVALSTSLTVAILLVLLARSLAATEDGFEIGPIVRVVMKSLAASLTPGIPVAILAWAWAPSLSFGAAMGLLVALALLGFVGYLGAARLLRLDEPRVILATIGRRSISLLRRA